MRGESWVTSRRAGGGASDDGTALVRLHLLGGFQAFRGDDAIPSELWDHRQAARTVVKILATAPGHRVHREQVLEFLWPGADRTYSLNRLGKAMHAARRVLEPRLPARVRSSYLALDGELLSLHPVNVLIDADDFECLARAALVTRAPAALETAIEAYSGELLPEDRYADWATARRQSIKTLHLDVLTALAAVCGRAGEYRRAIDHLREALLIDETPEETHCALMRLYALNGERDRALRQFRYLSEMLRRDLGIAPNRETQALFMAIQEGAFPPPPVTPVRGPSPLPSAISTFPRSPAVERESILEDLCHMLETSISGTGGIALLEGPPGIGKSHVLRELGRLGAERGVPVLWGASHATECSSLYSPFVTAVEAPLAALPLAEREAYARRYPELGGLISSLPVPDARIGAISGNGMPVPLQTDIARCLSDLAGGGPLLLLLDDLHGADMPSLQVLAYLVSRVTDRPWLIVATYESGQSTNRAFEDLRASIRRLPTGRLIGLGPLSRRATRVLLPLWLGDGRVGDLLTDHLHSLARGNPLFLFELVRSWREEGHVRREGGEWVASAAPPQVPLRVQTRVTEHIERLGQEIAALLALVSIAGTKVSFSFLHQVGSLSEACLVDTLERAVEARILEERDDCYVFSHPLVREALVHSLSRRRRMHLHGLVAQTLERAYPDDHEALAYHRSRARGIEPAIGPLESCGA